MGLLRLVLNLYILVILVDTVVSYIPNLASNQVFQFNRKLAEITLKPVRKMLSPDLPVDLSPAIVVILVFVLKAIW